MKFVSFFFSSVDRRIKQLKNQASVFIHYVYLLYILVPPVRKDAVSTDLGQLQ